MAHSLRPANREPVGSFDNLEGTKFTIYSNENGTWQRMDAREGTSEYRVSYVIGSGSHAMGYLIQLGDHLFQSPICYYTKRRAYGIAPGYEKIADPDFTRPITDDCVLCHSGKPMHVSGTLNRYEVPAFAQEGISCERCHGPSEQHLRRPVPGSIINPAKLKNAARDSVCEQCHLSGVVRILNPGKKFEDFRPGQTLEEVFTVYRDAVPPGTPPEKFKVISHPEQLAASACARKSLGKLWCGTCHDPHNKPLQTGQYYRDRCLSCHAGKLPATHPTADNCVGCHMPKRSAFDGGHTVFTDHRIMRRPEEELTSYPTGDELVAWREPDFAIAKRNLGLAYLDAGLKRNSPRLIVRGYRMLTEVQTVFPDDPAVFDGLGTALLLGGQAQEAKLAFDRLLQLDPSNPINEEKLGRAELSCGNVDAAISHLQKALNLDLLQLSTVDLLEKIYRERGNTAAEVELAKRIRQAIDGH
ncbi:MAG: hypothetical protein WB676_18120 [Bryobacteraceae bacterium]